MRTITTTLSGIVLSMGLVAVASAQPEHGHKAMEAAPPVAVTVLKPTKDNKVHGTITFTPMDGYVQVTGTVRGLEPGMHGFHIHEFGDLTAPDGTAAGGHFNPSHEPHGGPSDAKHHVGDLGNIEANARGVAKIDMKAEGLKTQSILGRSVVVHAKADDLKSQPSGDAGPRVAVGVIGYAQVTDK